VGDQRVHARRLSRQRLQRGATRRIVAGVERGVDHVGMPLGNSRQRPAPLRAPQFAEHDLAEVLAVAAIGPIGPPSDRRDRGTAHAAAIAARAARVSTQPMMRSTSAMSVVAVKGAHTASHALPKNALRRFTRTVALCRPISCWLNGCRTQFDSLMRSASITRTNRPGCPRATQKWERTKDCTARPAAPDHQHRDRRAPRDEARRHHIQRRCPWRGDVLTVRYVA
jgi:hypothetical protein